MFTTLQEEDGELYLALPDEVWQQIGAVPGSVLLWRDNGDGSFSIAVDPKEQNHNDQHHPSSQ